MKQKNLHGDATAGYGTVSLLSDLHRRASREQNCPDEETKSRSTDAIQVSEGDELTIEDRETKWEGWLWCIDTAGQEGWIPDIYVEHRNGRWAGSEDYVARELTVEPGETLASDVTVAGWEWYEKTTGEMGWVPAESLRSTSPSSR